MDYELVYELGKDEVDFLDFFFRYFLFEIGDDKIEKIIRWNVNVEYVVVVIRIREEIRKDEVM